MRRKAEENRRPEAWNSPRKASWKKQGETWVLAPGVAFPVSHVLPGKWELAAQRENGRSGEGRHGGVVPEAAPMSPF